MAYSSIILCAANLQNMGDLALLGQGVHAVRKQFPHVPIFVRQWAPIHASVVSQLEQLGVSVLPGKSLRACLLASRRALVLIAGGQMIRDNASSASVGCLYAMMGVARITDGATAIIACGASPLKRGMLRLFWRSMLRGCKIISTRDSTSRDRLVALCGPALDVHLAADLAFLQTPLHQELRAPQQRQTLVISPCDDPSEGRTVDARALAESAVRLARETGIERIVVAAHDSRANMDPVICGKILTALLETAPDMHVTSLQSFVLADFTSVYAGAGIVVTNRLHAIIFGIIAGAAVVVLDDGGSKTLDAARQFSLPVAKLCDFSSDMMKAVAAERRSGPPQARAAAIEAARDRAANEIRRLAALSGQPFDRWTALQKRIVSDPATDRRIASAGLATPTTRYESPEEVMAMAKRVDEARIEAGADLLRDVIIVLTERLLDDAVRPQGTRSDRKTPASPEALAADLHHLAAARAILQRRQSTLARAI